MKIYTKKEIAEIVMFHKKWLTNEGGQRANLSGAYLSGADLSGAYLSRADLSGAYLSRADLSGAYLSGANLSGAYLSRADLLGANLLGANLSRANLSGANLSRADLSRADLSGAYLSGANLLGAYLSEKDINLVLSYVSIVGEGNLIGYKKLKNNIIAKIEVHKNAKRIGGACGRKCRAEYVKVISVTDKDGKSVKEGFDLRTGNVSYRKGQIVKPDSFDPNPFNECSNGIHFFLTKLEAERWNV